MNTRDLEYFYALKAAQSYTAVAKEFGVSQPSISYAIKRLEEVYNCQLVVHDASHRTFALTEQGDILHRHLAHVLPELLAAKKEITRSLERKARVGFPPIITHYLLRTLESDQGRLQFLAHIHPIRGGSLELLDMLLSGDLDATLLASVDPLDMPNLQLTPIFDKDLAVVLAKDHPLAGEKELTFSQLLAENFILLDEHFVHLKAFDHLNRRHQQRAEIFLQSEDIDLVKSLVAKGVGVTLLADIALTTKDKNLVAIPLAEDDRLTFAVYFAHLKGHTPNPDLQALLDWLETYE